MKQHITNKQLIDLSMEAAQRLEVWLKAKGYPQRLNIGQMIEFLAEKEVIDEEFIYCQWELNNNCPSWVVNSDGENYRSKELCDALWEAVKEILEK